MPRAGFILAKAAFAKNCQPWLAQGVQRPQKSPIHSESGFLLAYRYRMQRKLYEAVAGAEVVADAGTAAGLAAVAAGVAAGCWAVALAGTVQPPPSALYRAT